MADYDKITFGSDELPCFIVIRRMSDGYVANSDEEDFEEYNSDNIAYYVHDGLDIGGNLRSVAIPAWINYAVKLIIEIYNGSYALPSSGVFQGGFVFNWSGTAEIVSENSIDAILTDTNELQGLISNSKLPAQIKGTDDIDFSTTQKSRIPTTTNIKDVVEITGGKIDLIKTQTDKIPATPASVGSEMILTEAYNKAKTALQAGDLENIESALAGLLLRLTESRAGYLDKLNVAGVLANTDNADNFKATSFTTADDLVSVNTALTTLRKILEADVVINKSNPAQWYCIWYEKGTTTVLFSKKLIDDEGNPINNKKSFLGGYQQ